LSSEKLCSFAHHLSRAQVKACMDKGERISRFVSDLVGDVGDPDKIDIVDHPYYRAYFQCWNEQRYYEAHDVLEQVWLNKDSEDDQFFKGLIQAAGAFVHLKLNFEHPTHPKHGRRLKPAVRLFALAEKNLSIFVPKHHALDVDSLVELLRNEREKIVRSDFQKNPWSPENAPKLNLIIS
jgi:predicted metal-dependent hydrolase